jgi:CSLREA domain-containing protein
MTNDLLAPRISLAPQSRKPSGWGIALGLVVLPLFLSAPVQAATFTVNSTLDVVDSAPGDGVCETAPGNGVCTLRAAIQEANALAGADVITLPAGTYRLTIPGQGENSAASGDLDITDNVAIAGAGPMNTFIDGGQLDRVFDVDPASVGISLEISDLLVARGLADIEGGAIRVNTKGKLTLARSRILLNAAIDGGGIFIALDGAATLVDVEVTSNAAARTGGGIYNNGNLEILNSHVGGDVATIEGGGIFNDSLGKATLTNVTLGTINVAGSVGPPGANGSGGGLSNRGSLTLTNGTVTGNLAANGGGILNNGIAQLKNTILADNAGGNCFGAIVSQGHNLDKGISCGFSSIGDISNTDPRLGNQLQNNGGSTVTQALLPGSPAIDAGDNVGCPATDQRGFPRPVDGNADGFPICDIGAFEAQTFTLSIVKTGAGSGLVASDLAGIDCGTDCSESYPSIPITLTATAAVGSVFSGWSGGGCSGHRACTLIPTADVSITAIFVDEIAAPPLVAAVLPSSRAVRLFSGGATAFAMITNTGRSVATDVRVSLNTTIPANFHFQATDPTTNAVIGTVNTPVDIPPGKSQSFLIALTPTGPIAPTEVEFTFAGTNAAPVTKLQGINTLLFSASPTPVPDVVALAATITNDGIVNIPGTNGTGAFAVATVNVGASGNINASADTGSASLPVNISLCQTDPGTGQCISAIGPSVTTTINANATPTFGIFLQGGGTVPFDPAANRIFVRFKDGGNVTRGSTSVAVRTQ